MNKNNLPSVFFEMLYSFVTMAECLNLAKAVRHLGTTRQTIRRHIRELEALKGEQLFVLVDRQYQLTEFGEKAHASAKQVLARSMAWASDKETLIDGLAYVSYIGDDGTSLHAQQHPLSSIWSMAPPLLKAGINAWPKAQAQLEHSALEKIRPYLIVYRKNKDEWLCVEIGERSSLATWLGWERAKSSIGINLTSDPINSKIDQFLLEAYWRVSIQGGHWYDHICSRVPRKIGETPEPANYQRLISDYRFPDGSPAIAVLAARTNNISLAKLKPEQMPRTANKLLMEFDV